MILKEYLNLTFRPTTDCNPVFNLGIEDRSRCHHLLVELNNPTSRWIYSVRCIGYHPKADNTMQSDKEKKKTDIQNFSNGARLAGTITRQNIILTAVSISTSVAANANTRLIVVNRLTYYIW
ncbi:MAG: hypothetical protein M3Y53_09995 [Thermoproteota archaeon]|nr:hypothetical protein [Thermoproteota archaeon]